MTCPHLVINAGKKICRRMLEDGLNGAVSDLDVKHYCKGKPIHCYYYRFPPNPRLLDWRADNKQKVEALPTTA